MFCFCSAPEKADADTKIPGMPEVAPQTEFPIASARCIIAVQPETIQSERDSSVIRRLQIERDGLALELDGFLTERPATLSGDVKQVSKETRASLRGVFTVTLREGVTVTETLALDSKVVAVFPASSNVIVIEAAEELRDGQVRARIFHPEGYISVWSAETWFIKKDNRLRDLLEASGVNYDSVSPRTLHAKDRQRAVMKRLKACEFSPVLYQLEVLLVNVGL